MSTVPRTSTRLPQRIMGWTILASVAGMLGCESDSPTCALVPVLGIQVHVTDAATQASLDDAARVTVSRLTAPFDSATGVPRIAVIITSSRPGSYRVRVEVPGYTSSSQVVNVPTSTRQCASVEPQNIVVALTRN